MRSGIDRRTRPPIPVSPARPVLWTKGLYALYAVCVLGLAVAPFNRFAWSAVAYVVIVVVGSVVLFRLRADEVRSARGKGENTVVGFRRYEVWALAAVCLSCLANAWVFAHYIAGRVGS